MENPDSPISTTAQKVLQVLEYLQALKSLSVPITRDLMDYRDLLWWESDLPVTDGCFLHGAGNDRDAWLEVHKQVILPPPPVPQVLEEWIEQSGQDPEKLPTHKVTLGDLSPAERDEVDHLPVVIEQMEEELASLEETDRRREVLQQQITRAYARWDTLEKRREMRFEDSPERVAAWETWLRDKWQSWADSATPKLKIQRLYGNLFTLYQRLQREGETLEVVWGHGLLIWQLKGDRIRRPLLVTRMELVFDASGAVFSLLPTEPGTILESDMLPPSLPNLDELAGWERRVRENGVDPRDVSLTGPLLTELVHILDPDGRCKMQERVSNPTGFSAVPTVYNAPVIFLRKRGATLWQRELQGVIDVVLQGTAVPRPLAALVSTDEAQLDDTSTQTWHGVGEDLLFPLPANEEQKEISRRLARYSGVVVQGPPGTGKSHTIVNLICHLLAHGKRILVTSHTEKALRVLGEKIKNDLPQISPLCVNVLGGDARSAKELEEAASAIIENFSSRDPEIRGREVERLRKELAGCREEIAGLWHRLRHAAEMEHSTVEVNDQAMEPRQAARWLSQNEREYGWFPDELPPNGDPPLCETEVVRLFELAGILLTEDVATLGLARPATNALPDVTTFRQITEELREREEALACLEKYLPCGGPPDDAEAGALSDLIRLAEETLRRLKEFGEPWVRRILDDASHGSTRQARWVDFHQECHTYIARLCDLDSQLAKHRVSLPAVVPVPELKAQLATLRARLEKGQLGWWFHHVSGRQFSRLLEESSLDGSTVRQAGDVDLLLLEAERRETAERLVTFWNNTMAGVEGPALDVSHPGLAAAAEALLEIIHEALDWGESCKPLAEAARRYLGSARRVWTDADWLTELVHTLRAAQAMYDLDRLRDYFARVRDYLIGQGGIAISAEMLHGSWAELVKALDDRDPSRWEAVLGELYRLEALEPLVAERDALLCRLRAVAPCWAASISTAGGRGEPLSLPVGWRQAWTWKRTDSWLRHLQRECNTEEVEERLQAARQRETRLLAALVAEEVWLHQLGRVTENQKRSLFAWVQAVKRIGKGTGKYVDRLRREARKHMQEARGAVPVWIMPIHRVLENFPPSGERFDVVIVDESSQCDIFALSILFKAQKAVIVGDANQISPEGAFTDQSQVYQLVERHLQGVPQATRFDLQASLYDLAEIAFSGHLMLKEHFRSVPEIIQFSNDLMYGGEIQPLRVPRRSEILDPPVVAVRVPDGYREEGTKVINGPEARALVAKVVEVCQRSEYAGRTMGVISLQGEDQARLIEDLLREKLGELEMLNRKIICGDSCAFQGDERDVMFLSMVAAPNVRIGPLTKRADMQRFNVAASRARDQMWLFHSVDMEDLNPSCMRARLLQYFRDPARVAKEEKEVEHLFESGFEREVYRLITARGYAVRPQVKVGTPGQGYRIDLVVEGLRARLAVECDGDKWHGIDKWEEDRQRQMDLERAGWKFWRVRASTFYRNHQKAMEPLWHLLDGMGIEPATRAPDQRRFQIVS